MNTHDATRRPARTPVSVRPGLGLAVAFVTVLLAVGTLPSAVADRATSAYLSAGLTGAALIVGVLLLADLARAAAARRAGMTVHGITLGALGSSLAVSGEPDSPSGMARLARTGPIVTAAAGAALLAAGLLAPSGVAALAGQVGIWVGSFALLLAAIDLIPSPNSGGGRLLAARAWRRTGNRRSGDAATAKAGVIAGWTLLGLGVGATLFAGFTGLWLVLIGWMTLVSSRVVQAKVRAATTLTGLTVADVMSPAPAELPGWHTIAAVLDNPGLPASASVVPVRDWDGQIAGAVLIGDIAAVPMDDRGLTRVARITVPLASIPTARPGDDLGSVVERAGASPIAGTVLVLDTDAGGRPVVVGLVGPAEMLRAIAFAPLRRNAGDDRDRGDDRSVIDGVAI